MGFTLMGLIRKTRSVGGYIPTPERGNDTNTCNILDFINGSMNKTVFKVSMLGSLLLGFLVCSTSLEAAPKKHKPAAVKTEDAINSSHKRSTIEQIEFRDVTVGDALKILSDQSNLNIIASREAASIPVTMFLRRVTALEVVDALAKTYNLWYQHDPESKIIRIYTVKEYRLEQVEFKQEETEVFTLKNAKNALDLAENISNLFYPRVRMSYGRSQSELMYDLQQRFSRFDYVDRRTTQRFNSSSSTGGSSSSSSSVQGGGNTQISGNNQQGVGGNQNMGGNQQGVGGNQNMGGNQSFGGNQGAGQVGGNNQQQQQQMDESLRSLDTLLKGLNSSQQGNGQPGQSSGLSRQLSGDYDESRDMVKLGVRKQAPIYVGVIKHQNRVLVRTRDADAMKEIRGIYKRLDVESSMLLMEVKILAIDLSDGFNSLFDISMVNNHGTVNGALQTGAAESTAISAASGALQGGAALANPALLVTAVGQNFDLKMQLMEQENRVTQLATPILLTSNQEVSRFFVGTTIPVVTGFSPGSVQTTGSINGNTITVPPVPTYTNREVGNTLLLTPNINADNTVNIQVLVEQSQVVSNGATMLVSTGSVLESVTVDTVEEKTFSGSVMAKDNTTVAVGGLIQEAAGNSATKVPWLGDIPGLGYFFSSKGLNRSRTELVVIIKPHIITSLAEAQRFSEEMMKQNSVHPNAENAGSMGVYSNPDRDPKGYKLEQPFKEYNQQDSLDIYKWDNPNPLR